MPKKAFYNYTAEEVMAADIEKVGEKQLLQYAGLRIFVNYTLGILAPPDPAYNRCTLEIVRRMPLEKREHIFKCDPLQESLSAHLPVIDMYVLQTLGEKQRDLMTSV